MATLTISFHCRENMTRAMLVKSLHYRRYCTARRDTGTAVGDNRSISSLHKFGKQMLTCATGFLFALKVLLSFDFPFLRLAVHRQTDGQTYSTTTVTLRCACVRGLTSYLRICPLSQDYEKIHCPEGEVYSFSLLLISCLS